MEDDQKLMKKRLKVLMNRPENQVCSDCTERQPRWASLIVPPPGAPPGSLAIGAFCCLECSGSHRRLGVHISFVRSINLDSWKEKEVLAMENGGNAKVNAIFEARLNVAKPSNQADLATRERFIRDKYERRRFYDQAAFQRLPAQQPAAAPPVQAPRPQQQPQQEEMMPALSSSHQQHQPAGNVGVPSAAARKRLESRKSSIESTSSTSARARVASPFTSNSSVSSTKSRSKSTAQQQPVADLLDFNASSESLSRRAPQQRKKDSDFLAFPDDPMEQAPPKPLSKKKSSKKQDDFADFASVASNSSSGDFGDFSSAPSTVSASNTSRSNTSKTQPNNGSNAAQSIMSLYNATPGNVQSFAPNNGMGMSPMNSMNTPMTPNIGNMTAMIQQMNLQSSNNSGMQGGAAAISPELIQQQAIMYQQHMMRLAQIRQQQANNGLGMIMMMQGNAMGTTTNMNGGGGVGGFNNNNGMGMMSMNTNNSGMGMSGMSNPMVGMGGTMNFPSMQAQQQPLAIGSMGTATMGIGGVGGIHPKPTSNKDGQGATDPFASLSARHGF